MLLKWTLFVVKIYYNEKSLWNVRHLEQGDWKALLESWRVNFLAGKKGGDSMNIPQATHTKFHEARSIYVFFISGPPVAITVPGTE